MKTLSRNSPGLPAISLETKPWMLGHLIWLVLLLCQFFLTTVRAAPNVIAWGSNDSGQSSVPVDLTNAVALACGDAHSLALQADGTVVAWGAGLTNKGAWPDFGQSIVPTGLTNVVAVAAGSCHSLALRADGTVEAWGSYYDGDDYNPMWVPDGFTNVIAITAGAGHNLALRADGTVVAWGATWGWPVWPASVPSGLSNVVAVATGDDFALALQADGGIVVWASSHDPYSVTNVPVSVSNVVAIAGGGNLCVALRADGTVIAWPEGGNGEANVPATLSNVIAVAAGWAHGLALRTDGTIVPWGSFPQLPAGLSNVVAVAAGSSHNLALVGAGAPHLTVPLTDRAASMGGTVYWRAAASGAWPLSYQWQFNGTNLPDAINAALVLTNVHESQAGAYSLIVSNALGRVSSPPARLNVVPVLLNAHPQDQVTYVGGTVTFSVGAEATMPLAYQWRFNGDDLPGATNSTLTLTTVKLDQAGAYSVKVSNPWGEVTSREAQLYVNVVAAWGFNGYDQTDVPAGLSNVVAVAGGGIHSLALRTDGTVVAWGGNSPNANGQSDVPAGLTNVVAIDAGGYIFDFGGQVHSLALRADGTVIAWGEFGNGPVTVPNGLANVVSIAAGGDHDLALRADGTVVAWGVQAGVPPGLTNVVAVAAGVSHDLALRADGTVVAWGYNGWDASAPGPTDVPVGLTNVIAIAAGCMHSLALRASGTVVGWGIYFSYDPESPGGERFDPVTIPSGLSNVVAVSSGEEFSAALKSDGRLVMWGPGWGDGSSTSVPPGLTNVAAVSAGGGHCLVLIGGGLPVVSASLSNATRTANGFSVSVPTQSGRVYALEYKHWLADAVWTPLPLVAGTGHERTLSDPTATGAQRFYRVRRW